MALRVKCKCGRKLSIPSKLAGRKLKCPGCQKAFRIPAERFETARRQAEGKAARPAQAAARPAPALPEPTPEPMELDLGLGGDGSSMADLSGEASWVQSGVLDNVLDDAARDESAAKAVEAPRPVIQAAVVAELVEAEPIGYAVDAGRRRPTPKAALLDEIQGPRRGFWEDAFLSFAYPFRPGGNAITFVFIGLLACLKLPLQFAGCLGLIGSIIIAGYLAALYFSVIAATAKGSEDLPGIRMEEGFMGDVIAPLLRYIGAHLVALGPAAVLSIALAFGWLPSSFIVLAPLWWACGAFLMPVCLLLFAFDTPGMLLRPDLIVLTIVRTILPYLAMWAMLALVVIFYVVIWLADELERLGLGFLAVDLTDLGVFGVVLLYPLDVYLSIVAMRLVGLYYLHFERRFAIVVE